MLRKTKSYFVDIGAIISTQNRDKEKEDSRLVHLSAVTALVCTDVEALIHLWHSVSLVGFLFL